MKSLTIIIPVYNEVGSVREALNRISLVTFPIPYEVIVVDDGSTDGTREILQNEFSHKYQIIFHQKNQGKGSAIRTGLKRARGNIFVVQDADLEYDPNDLVSMLSVLLNKNYDVIYGSRVLGKKRKKYSSYLFHLGGLLVTWWTNLLYQSSLTDEATCYKMFTQKVLDKIKLTCRRFEFCPELTGKLLKAGFPIHEVPISYHPRSRKQGKKMKIKDGFVAFWTLFRMRFF